jgi:hypothetical protein
MFQSSDSATKTDSTAMSKKERQERVRTLLTVITEVVNQYDLLDEMLGASI